MDDKEKERLKGSPSRDTFKQKHKVVLNNKFYACDLDFVLVAKYPFRIVAFLDYKRGREGITFSEVVAYNVLLQIAPIYIIRGNDPETGPFQIYKYNWSDPVPEPPNVELIPIRQCEGWPELGNWERELRKQGGKLNDERTNSKPRASSNDWQKGTQGVKSPCPAPA